MLSVASSYGQLLVIIKLVLGYPKTSFIRAYI